MTTQTKQKDAPRPWVNGQVANGRRFIPDVPVVTHAGDAKLFYHDLVRDRCVVFQFTSIGGFNEYPVTRNLQNVQRLLGEACGRDIFLFTITSDPFNDTPERFAEFAKQFRPGTGWQFLSGAPDSIESIKRALFVHSVVAGSAGETQPITIGGDGRTTNQTHDHQDCSQGLMRYGNDAAGLWGSVPTKLDPKLIVQRLDWIRPKGRMQMPKRLTRKGPLRES